MGAYSSNNPTVRLISHQLACAIVILWTSILLASSAFADASAKEAAKSPGGIDSSNLSSDLTAQSIRELVSQLGGQKFHERESATIKLIELGSAAQAFVANGISSDDLEISTRCKLIATEIRHQERLKLMRRFQSESVDAAKIPGWSQFSAIVGDHKSARDTFLFMIREEWMFVEDVIVGGEAGSGDYRRGSQYLTNRCVLLQHAMRARRSKLRESTLAALLFASCLENVEMQNPGVLLGFCTRTECQRYLFVGEHRDVLLKLLSTVLLKAQSDETLAQRMYLAARYGLREGVILGRRAIEDPLVRTYTRQCGILLVARFGDTDDRQILEPLLKDATVSIQARNVQIRDIALATLIHLHGEELSDYGFKNTRRDSMMVFSASSLGFMNHADRSKALAMWRDRHVAAE